MAPVPEHRAFGLVPPAEHEIDFIATAVDLQFKILLGTALALAIPCFNSNVQVVK